MIGYDVFINNGVEAFSTEGKTITVNEATIKCDSDFLAHHMHLHNQLIPESVAKEVLSQFAICAAELMGQGYQIQFKNGNDVVMRLYPDIHIKGGNINLTRAQELDPTVTEITTENAGDLVTKAGVTIRAKAECESKFTELLHATKSSLQRGKIVERAKVMRKDSTNESNTGNNNSGDNGGEGGGANNE